MADNLKIDSLCIHNDVEKISQEIHLKSVILVDSIKQLDLFNQSATGLKTLTVDAEGVNLSRNGEITLLSIALKLESGETKVFLFDLIYEEQDFYGVQMVVLKKLLEDKSIEKIIHDCRQDSDALFVHKNISLTSVFDTSVYIMKIQQAVKRINLNQALSLFSCHTNENRVVFGNVYKDNPAFWRTRPMTDFMIQYASQDVSYLFDLQDKILATIAADVALTIALPDIIAASTLAVSEFRAQQYSEVVYVPHDLLGRVIGKQGSGIASIEANSGALLCTVFQEGILVLADSEGKLDTAKALILKMYEKFLVPVIATSESADKSTKSGKSNNSNSNNNNNKSNNSAKKGGKKSGSHKKK